MPKRAIRQLPRENFQGAWPQLEVSPQDRHYIPEPESALARRWRRLQGAIDMVALDAAFASFKGAALGLFVFAVTFSFITLRLSGFGWAEQASPLLVGWHWAFAIGGILLLLLLTGFEFTLLVLAVIALWLSRGAIIAQPRIALLFIGGGVLLRLLLEFFPGKNR